MWNIILEIATPIGFIFAAVFFGLWRTKADESSEYFDMLTRWNSDHEIDIEKLKKQYDTDLEFYKKLAHDAMDRANRNGAIAEGLAEDLAALKAYDPEEIEKRLKKIQEIRADEERQKANAELNAMLFQMAASVIMPNPYGVNPLPSCGYGTGITWR